MVHGEHHGLAGLVANLDVVVVDDHRQTLLPLGVWLVQRLVVVPEALLA